nr:MAG TPA: protein of unknown function (DUF4258) [Caudoviricetes sp.]
MDLTNIFYREVIGIYPFPTNREEAITRHTVEHLKESGITESEILKMLPDFKRKQVIMPADLSDSLWKDSLIERDVYYCHHVLQLVPPVPVIKSSGAFKDYPFYLEIRIRFTEKDLLKYFYDKAFNFQMIKDSKRDTAQLLYMLNRYNHIEGIQGLDLLLFMIDEAVYRHIIITEPFDIKISEIEVFTLNKLRGIINERHAKGYDKIKYRDYLIEDGEIIWQIPKE